MILRLFAQMAPKSSPNRPRSRQVGPKMLILAVMLAYLGALGRHLGPKLLQLGPQEASRWSLEVFFSTFFGNLLQVPRETAPKVPKMVPWAPLTRKFPVKGLTRNFLVKRRKNVGKSIEKSCQSRLKYYHKSRQSTVT